MSDLVVEPDSTTGSAVKEIDFSILHDIAFNDSATFISLLSSISQATFDRLLLTPNKKGKTLLFVHIKDQAFLLSVLKAASDEAIEKLLGQQDERGFTLLAWPEIKQNSGLIQLLVQRASSSVLGAVLAKTDKTGRTTFQAVLNDQDAPSCQALIAKIDEAVLASLVMVQGQDGESPLSIAARYQDSHSVRAILDKLSLEVKNSVFLLRNQLGETVFHALCYYQDHACVAKCIEEAYVETISIGLSWVCAANKSVLSTVAIKQNAENYKALVNKARVEPLAKALQQQDAYGQTALCITANKKDDDCFQTLLNKVKSSSVESIDAALMKIHAKHGGTALHVVADSKSPSSFQLLLQSANSSVVDKMLPKRNKNGETVFSIALMRQDEESCRILINMMNAATLDKLIQKKNKKGYTGLWLALTKLKPEILQGLFDKASAKPLLAAVQEQSFSSVQVPFSFTKFALFIHKSPRYMSSGLACLKDYRWFNGPDKHEIIDVLACMTKPAKMVLKSPDKFVASMNLMISADPMRISHHQDWLAILDHALGALKKQKGSSDTKQSLKLIRDRVRFSEKAEGVPEEYQSVLDQANRDDRQHYAENFNKHLARLSVYVERRKKETRTGFFACTSLFGYSHADYILRAGIYARLVASKDQGRQAQKDILEEALRNSKITNGWRHQCADILRSMLKDVNHIMRLESESPERRLSPVAQ